MSNSLYNLNIKINCHSSICINDSVYIDPFEITSAKNNASHIFITHPHYDHFDLKSIFNIINFKTVIIGTKEVVNKLKEYDVKNKLVVVSNESEGEVDGITYSTFPAYNDYHKKIMGFVGYCLTIDGVKYTICGDTNDTEELAQLKTDVLLIPIGGTYTMNAVEAANITNIIKPKLAIPTHYNYLDGTGTKQEEKIFLEHLNKDIPVKVLI